MARLCCLTQLGMLLMGVWLAKGLMSSSGTLFGGKGEKPESPASGNVSCQWRGAILAIVLIKRNQWARLKR